jgi:hypothetical protein
MTMANVKYVLLILCAFSVCAKTIGHTDRHLQPHAAAETTVQ